MLTKTAYGYASGMVSVNYFGKAVESLAKMFSLSGCENWVIGKNFIAMVNSKKGKSSIRVYIPTKALKKAVNEEAGVVKTPLTLENFLLTTGIAPKVASFSLSLAVERV